MDTTSAAGPLSFGEFELDVNAGELRRHGRRVKLQPQPFKLLVLLASRAGGLVGRDEIRTELWPEGTFVDFDQAVNFSIKQIREVLRDPANRPLYVETVPKRGYRFIAPVTVVVAAPPPSAIGADGTTVRLQKALWTNIAELRLAEERRRMMLRRSGLIAAAVLAALVLWVLTQR